MVYCITHKHKTNKNLSNTLLSNSLTIKNVIYKYTVYYTEITLLNLLHSINIYAIIIMHTRVAKVNKYLLIAKGNFSHSAWQYPVAMAVQILQH